MLKGVRVCDADSDPRLSLKLLPLIQKSIQLAPFSQNETGFTYIIIIMYYGITSNYTDNMI